MTRIAALARTAASQRFGLRSFGDGIDFTGITSQFVSLPNLSLYSFIQNIGTFTLGCLYKPNNSNKTSGLLGNTGLSTEKGFIFVVNGNGQLVFQAFNGSGAIAFTASSVLAILPDNYFNMTFLCLLSCTAGGNLKFSIGEFRKPMIHESRGSSLTSLSTGDSTNTIKLAKGTSSGFPMRGNGLEWFILQQDLTNAEKDTFYLTGRLPSGVTGSIYEKLSSANGTNVPDAGSFANNGTINGGAGYIAKPFTLLNLRAAAAARAAA